MIGSHNRPDWMGLIYIHNDIIVFVRLKILIEQSCAASSMLVVID